MTLGVRIVLHQPSEKGRGEAEHNWKAYGSTLLEDLLPMVATNVDEDEEQNSKTSRRNKMQIAAALYASLLLSFLVSSFLLSLSLAVILFPRHSSIVRSEFT